MTALSRSRLLVKGHGQQTMADFSSNRRQLGSLEFISAINGDDPIAALRALHRFVRTVRRERKLALYSLPRRSATDAAAAANNERRAEDDDDDGDDNSNAYDGDEGQSDDDDDIAHILEEDAISSQSKKRRRAAASSAAAGGNEEWKVDKAGYNVPFVGTSVVKGSVGTITPGIWPCGLLRAYLNDSPRAVELLGGMDTSDDTAGANNANTNQLVPPNGALHKSLIKGGKAKLSQLLHQTYLEAIAEVATAVVPTDTIVKDMIWQYGTGLDVDAEVEALKFAIEQLASSSANEGMEEEDINQPQQEKRHDVVASILAREHLRPLLHLLNDQCSQSASFDAKHGGGSGSGGGRHRVGPLTSTVLQVLTNIAASGVGAAREVVRGLDSELRDGALRAALASFSGGGTGSASGGSGKKRKASEAADMSKSTMSKTAKKKSAGEMDARTAALRLCSSLIESSDPTVLSFTCSPGSRERKTNAGIVHAALRLGLAGGIFDSRAGPVGSIPSADELDGKERYLQSIGRLVTAVRTSTLPCEAVNGDLRKGGRSTAAFYRPGLDSRIMSELINGDVIDRLIRISTYAPPLSDAESSYKAVLSAVDRDGTEEDDPHVRYLRLAAVQCRRLLFILLADKHRSPFLLHITANDDAKDASGRSSPQEHLVNRALLSFVSDDCSLPMRAFILHCLRASPVLLFPFFRSLPMPDPKPTYKCLSALAFVSNILSDGPNVSACVSLQVPSRADQVIPFILPLSLSKAFLTKALQSTNAFLVAEALRVICDVIKRVENYTSTSRDDNSFKFSLGESLQKRLPDLQMLLALRSRFDPFATAIDEDAMDDAAVLSKEEVVTLRLCETLQGYGRVLPGEVVSGVKFDWTKLFPNDIESFFRVSSVVQLAILKTFGAVGMQTGSKALALVSKAFRSFLTISLSSTSLEVYDLSRALAIRVILSIAPMPRIGRSESHKCLEYEAYVWVDGASAETLEELCNLVTAALRSSMQHTLSASRAWTCTFPSQPVPVLCFSGLLSSAVAGAYLCAAEFSRPFIDLVCQVATKSILYHSDPRPLAAFIKYSSLSARSNDVSMVDDGDDDSEDPKDLLYQYALVPLGEGSTRPLDSFLSLVCLLFGKDSLDSQLVLAKSSQDLILKRVASGSLDVVIRQCLNLLDCIREEEENENDQEVRQRLHQLVQLAVMASSESGRGDQLPSILQHHYIISGCGSEEEMTRFVISLSSSQPHGRPKYPCFDVFARLWLCRVVRDDGKEATLSKATAALAASLANVASPSFSVSLIKFLLERCSSKAQTAQDLLLCHTLLMTIMNSSDTTAGFDSSFPVHHLLKLWTDLASGNIKGDEQVITPLGMKLQDVMRRILLNANKQGVIAANLSICLLGDISNVIECYMRTSKKSKTRDNLLTAMLSYDCAAFAPPLATWLRPSELGAIRRKLGDQFGSTVDNVLIAYLKQLAREPGTALLSSPLISLSKQRIVTALAQGTKDIESNGIAQVKDWFQVLAVILSDCSSNNAAVFGEVLGFLEVLAMRKRLKIDCEEEECVLDAALTLLLSYPVDALRFDKLGAFLFLRLGDLLPRALRKGPPTGRGSKDHCPIFILRSLIRLLEDGKEVDVDTVLKNEAILRGCVVSCLKYGIRDATRDGTSSDIAALCLRLARLLVVKSATDTSMKNLQQRVELLRPSQVHMMVTSHSSFKDATSTRRPMYAVTDPGESEPTSSRLELIYLLISCASLDQSCLEINDDIWATLLQGYGAGVDSEDRALRRLMHLYNAASEENNTRFVSDLRWGVPSGVTGADDAKGSNLNGGDHAGHYEWFVQALDIHRVRSTLMSFPVWESLVPEVDVAIETWTATGNEDVSSVDSEDEDSVHSQEDENIDVASSDGKETGNRLRRKPTEDKGDRWSGQGSDDRYCPPFVISLVLATLEEFHPPAGSKESSQQPDEKMSGDDMVENEQGVVSTDVLSSSAHRVSFVSFVKIARRLSDKGCIGLTLAALSSKCPNLRGVAVATLGFFLKAIHTQEAHELKTWRERPQIAMILDSVQRGLVVRRAISIARRKEQGTDDEPLLVSMLPAVSAVFLGWASLIVSRPSDDMFPSVNRTFLRLGDYHGAYKDCFALPAFMSLFCGSFSEDNSHARKERLWALQFLKDGTRDAYCYKVAARRHVPELIMSSFDSLVSRGGLNKADAEPYLLLEALEVLLLNGGRMSRHHLISSHGIISWMRGLLVARLHSSLFPSVKMFYTFIELVKSAFHCAAQQAKEEPGRIGDVRTQALDMAEPLVSAYMFFADSADTHVPSTDALQKLLDTLDIMSTVALTQPNNVDAFIDSFREDGINMVTALELLKSSSGNLYIKVVQALSTLPLSAPSSDGKAAKQLCLHFLSFVSDDVEADASRLSARVLTRVSHIISAYSDTLCCDTDLIESVLACKIIAQGCAGGLSALLHCLSRLLPEDVNGDENETRSEAVLVAKQVVEDTRTT